MNWSSNVTVCSSTSCCICGATASTGIADVAASVPYYPTTAPPAMKWYCWKHVPDCFKLNVEIETPKVLP